MKGLNNPIGIKSLEPNKAPFIINPYRFGGAGEFMSATGGNTAGAVDGDYKYHIFTSGGTFTPTVGTDVTYGNIVEYLVIAGGGGSGGDVGGYSTGGGGGGGYRTATGFVVSDTGYTITVGAGGAGGGGGLVSISPSGHRHLHASGGNSGWFDTHPCANCDAALPECSALLFENTVR